MCICVCVCVCVCMCVCMYVCIYVRMHVCMCMDVVKKKEEGIQGISPVRLPGERRGRGLGACAPKKICGCG